MSRMLAAAIGLVLVVAGCSAKESDFKDAAEKTLRSELLKTFPDATFEIACDDPSSTDVGTTFTCTFTDPDRNVNAATAEITGRKTFVIHTGDANDAATGDTVADVPASTIFDPAAATTVPAVAPTP